MKNRKYPRLKHYNYRSAGAYFLTLVCHQRRSLFGDIHDGIMIASPLGNIVISAWNEVPRRTRFATLDTFALMPNHFHAILWLQERNERSINQIINLFKGGVTRQAEYKIWQRSFYDRVIRNENELLHIRQYIMDNAKQWESDRLYISGAH